MELFQTIIFAVSAIVLFVHGLQNFSKEIERRGADNLKLWIQRVTSTRLGGFLLGGIVTGIIQSSTTVSTLTVSLVDAGVISFKNSLLILLGTNVGTTSTGWIVTFQSVLLGPIFIVLGTLISLIPTRISTIGKSIFYFGLIFFSLNLISDALEPIRDDPRVVDWLLAATNPFIGVVAGIIITVIIQSSSVVVGLVIVLVAQGLMSLDAAIPIIVGANVGTTSTAFIVSLQMSPSAKLTALTNFMFNFCGMLMIFPFMAKLGELVQLLSAEPAIQVALALTLSNMATSVAFLLLLNPVYRLLSKHKWYPHNNQTTVETPVV